MDNVLFSREICPLREKGPSSGLWGIFYVKNKLFTSGQNSSNKMFLMLIPSLPLPLFSLPSAISLGLWLFAGYQHTVFVLKSNKCAIHKYLYIFNFISTSVNCINPIIALFAVIKYVLLSKQIQSNMASEVSGVRGFFYRNSEKYFKCLYLFLLDLLLCPLANQDGYQQLK